MAGTESPTYRPSGNIIVCGRAYQIDWPVVNWYDNPNFSAYYRGCYKGKGGGPPTSPYPFSPAKGMGQMLSRFRERRLMGGSRELRRLQEIIRQFVVHHDGCQSSEQCFHVLHDERGLSVHFLIDNDGTIYQTLDLVDGAFHATGVNEISIGVELCNRGKVELDGRDFYRRKFPNNPMVRDRNIVRVQIHGSTYEMWDYTPGQYGAMFALGKALARLFPNLPQVFPEQGGYIVPTWLAEPRSFSGYLGHFHVTNQKWDPGAFNFKLLCQKIRSRASWFVCLDRGECRQAPEVADTVAQAEEQAAELVRNNEEEAMGGYFPIGPFGKARLWHGGIHISLPEGSPVFCPFPGRIVAARSGDDVPTGSRNFVLTRHTFSFGGTPVTFFLLFMHLEREDPSSSRTPWFQGADQKPFWPAIEADEVAFPDVDVAGGEIIGRVGHAGPPGNFEGQLHFQAMSVEDLGQRLQPGFWRSLDASHTGHFCDLPEIIRLIDRPRGRGDGLISEPELRTFFQSDPARAELRKLSVRFQSEWGADPDYLQALMRARDFARLPKAARLRLFRDQIEPTLWWTQEVAERVGLPKDFVVWHYHPVRFVAWMNELLRQRAGQAVQVKVGEYKPAVEATDGYEGDVGYTDEEDELSLEAGRKLTLEDLARGYPDDPK
ncbi:MAG: N-acetylmuramoyl-L-alanine amidase [Myxococcales bacterium]|nr:N-acetylmuramoyl-L-alanine amidase [Myxococcota bacterium]MDW8282592.1 N-acetylmuramoyl-L-alanine amidase [Myxococcales bacterium]